MKTWTATGIAFVGLILTTTTGCGVKPQASSASQKPESAAAKTVLAPKEPVVFTPPKSDNAVDAVSALKEANARFKDYALSQNRSQMELRDVDVTVLNSMEEFTAPMTASSPGRFEFGGQGRTVSPDERNKVSEEVRSSTTAYLERRLRVTKGARFEVVVALAAGRGVRIMNGFDPYGIEIFRTYLVDTSAKSVVWCSGMEGYGKTLDAATKVAASGVPEQLDVLFGIKK